MACAHVQPPPNRRPPDPAGDDPHLISVVGEGTCCLYQIEAGNTLRPLPTALTKRESQGYTCHAWLLDGDAAGSEAAFVVGTKRGEVLVVAHGEVKQALALEDGAGVTSLAAHSKVGAGGWGGGQLLRRSLLHSPVAQLAVAQVLNTHSSRPQRTTRLHPCRAL